jgi:ribosomal-protein-alanine N-acetyltransferase
MQTPRIELRGDEVAIRPYDPEDAQALLDVQLRNRDFFAPYEPSHIVVPTTLAEQLARLDEERSDWDKDRGYKFGIFATEDPALLGQVQLAHVMRQSLQTAELGYWMDRKATGKGYATEGVRLALRFAFEHVGLHRVQAGAMRSNRASIRVLEKAGFRHEGTAVRLLEINGVWEDHEIYAITHEEWTGDAVT